MPVRARYESLDAWRGVAALAVLLFHCSNTVIDPQSGAGRLLHLGWAGVFVFFPVSGYCIVAAMDASRHGTVRGFLARRWQRIFPTYWASVALTSVVLLMALPFNQGRLSDITLTPGAWLSIATLTQVFTPYAGEINPVYWSLCYEEQFYIVVGLTLLLPRVHRVPVLAATSALAAGYLTAGSSWRVQGLFLEYWLCFAAGIAVHVWLHASAHRAWAILIAVAVGAMALRTGDPGLTISAVTALALVAFARWDHAVASARVLRPLIAVGVVSYSLYLVHVPVGGRTINLLARGGVPAPLRVLAGVAVSLLVAMAFHRLIEAPTRPTRSVSDSKPQRVPVMSRPAAAPSLT